MYVNTAQWCANAIYKMIYFKKKQQYILQIRKNQEYLILEQNKPDRKKYSLLKDKYFCEDSSIRYLRSKIFEYGQWMRVIKYPSAIKIQSGAIKYPSAILNIRGRGGQKRNSFLFCSNSQHHRS